MYILIAIIFVLGYVAIAFEHPLKIDKAAFAIFTAVVCWSILILSNQYIFPEMGEKATHFIGEELMLHLSEISGILFFLLGAMTIVELVDAHGGFSLITDKITTTNKSTLLIILGIVTFFMSAALDNLTTSIVMATLLRKLIKNTYGFLRAWLL